MAIVCGEIGVELFDKERHTEAEEFFTSAIQHNPKVSWFYVCRARTRYELKVNTRRRIPCMLYEGISYFTEY